MNGIINQMNRLSRLFKKRLLLSPPQKEQLANLFTNLSSALFISLIVPILFGVDIPQPNAVILSSVAGIILEIMSLLIVK